MIKRFTLHQDQRDGPWWDERPDGMWVKHEDYRKELDALIPLARYGLWVLGLPKLRDGEFSRGRDVLKQEDHTT